MTTNPHQTDVPLARSTPELLDDLSNQVTRLIRDEIQLATAELEAKGKRFGFGAGLYGVVGVLAVYAGGALTAAVVLLLAQMMSPWLAALVVSMVVAVVATVMGIVARDQVRKAAPPVPTETAASVRQDLQVVRESLRRR